MRHRIADWILGVGYCSIAEVRVVVLVPFVIVQRLLGSVAMVYVFSVIGPEMYNMKMTSK